MTYSPKAFQIATLGTSQIGKFVSADDAGDIIIPNDDKLEFGTASDAAILWDTTGTNHLAIATASSAPITIGNATSEVTIGDNLTVTGDLTVNGTTTTVNSTTLTVDDKLIELAHSPAGSIGADTDIDGGGILLKSSDGDKSIVWTNSTDSWDFNQGGIFAGVLKTDDTTDATTKTDGSLQTDGGLSVAKAIYNGTAATLAADSGIVTIGSTTAATFSAAGLLNINNATDATSKTDGSLQTDGGLSVAKAIYNGTAATLAADSGVVTIGSTTAATFSAAGLLNVNNATDATSKTDGSLQTDGGLSVAKKAYIGTGLTVEAGGAHLTAGRLTIDDTTEATSTTDGSLQTDGGLSVAKSAVIGDDLDLLSDNAIFSMGLGSDFTITHDTTGATLAGNPITITSGGAATWSTSAGALTIDAAAAGLTLDGHTGVTVQSSNSGDITLDSAADIVVDAAGGNVEFKDAGVLQLTLDMDTTSAAQLIKLGVDGDDLLFQQYDGRTILTVADAGYVAIGNGATGSGELRIYEDTDAGTNFTAFKVAAQAADITYTLPTDDGDENQVLSTDGDGVLDWVDVTASTATVATTVTVTDNEAGDEDNLIAFVADGATATGSHGLEMDGHLYYSPLQNRLTSTDIEVTGVFVNSVDISATSGATISKGFTGVTPGGSNSAMVLPAAVAGNIGAMYTVKKLDTAAGQVQITRAGSDTIDGANSVVLYHQYESVTVICVAAGKWHIM